MDSIKSRPEFRREARECLKGKWGKATLIVFCSMLVAALPRLVTILFSCFVSDESIQKMVSSLASIVQLLISAPFTYGVAISFLKLKRGEAVKAFDFVKIGFSNFSMSWSISINILFKMLLPIFLLIASLLFFSCMTSIEASNSRHYVSRY